MFSERLEVYLLLVEHFGMEYEVGRYGYTGWYEIEEKILPLLSNDVALLIIEMQNNLQEVKNLVKRIRLYAFSGVILFISKTEERFKQIEEKISIIDAGVDEYLGYPQTSEEIIASVTALLRRIFWMGDYRLEISGKQFQINPQTRKVFMDGMEYAFTKIEFSILSYLVVHLNRAVSYKELYEAVWNKEYLHDDMNIMAHVHRIRKKMGDDVKSPLYIQNVYGIGYMIKEE